MFLALTISYIFWGYFCNSLYIHRFVDFTVITQHTVALLKMSNVVVLVHNIKIKFQEVYTIALTPLEVVSRDETDTR